MHCRPQKKSRELMPPIDVFGSSFHRRRGEVYEWSRFCTRTLLHMLTAEVECIGDERA